jgi:hypothetical protein
MRANPAHEAHVTNAPRALAYIVKTGLRETVGTVAKDTCCTCQSVVGTGGDRISIFKFIFLPNDTLILYSAPTHYIEIILQN